MWRKFALLWTFLFLPGQAMASSPSGSAIAWVLTARALPWLHLIWLVALLTVFTVKAKRRLLFLASALIVEILLFAGVSIVGSLLLKATVAANGDNEIGFLAPLLILWMTAIMFWALSFWMLKHLCSKSDNIAFGRNAWRSLTRPRPMHQVVISTKRESSDH